MKGQHRRTESRRLALNALYAVDGGGAIEKIKDVHAQSIVDGVLSHRLQIDALIGKYSTSWSLERMPSIDRNILRMGIYEIIYETQAPVGAIANDCVELAKLLSGEDSPRFVNAILSRVTQDHSRSQTNQTP